MSAAFSHSHTHFTTDNKTPQGSNGTNATESQAAQPNESQENEPHELIADRPPPPESETTEPSNASNTSTDPAVKPRRPRGFAAMDRKLVSEIARKGGKAAHSAGTAHEFTTDEARVAGRKGGRATHAKRRAGKEGVMDASGTTVTNDTPATPSTGETEPTERH